MASATSKRSSEPAIYANQDLVKFIGRKTLVLVVSSEGRLGEMPCAEALQVAKDAGSDLVAVAMKAKPPVVKLTSVAKLQYAHDRQASQLRAMQRAQKQKEMRFSSTTESNDLENKAGKVINFLTKGHPVKITVRFVSGTPPDLQEPLRRGVMRRLVHMLDEYGVMTESSLNNAGRDLSGVFQPAPRGEKLKEGTLRNESVLAKLETPVKVAVSSDDTATAFPGGRSSMVVDSEVATAMDDDEDSPRGPAAGKKGKGKGRGGSKGTRKPKGSPSASLEEQRAWREGVGHTTEVEADVDSVLGTRDGDDVLGGARQRSKPSRAAASGVSASGRANAGGDGPGSRA
jgi:translation initiation factor IF-3